MPIMTYSSEGRQNGDVPCSFDNDTLRYLLDATRGCDRATRVAARGANREASRKAFMAKQQRRFAALAKEVIDSLDSIY